MQAVKGSLKTTRCTKIRQVSRFYSCAVHRNTKTSMYIANVAKQKGLFVPLQSLITIDDRVGCMSRLNMTKVDKAT